MIDAGESEDNIATVIKHYTSQTASPPVSALDMASGRVGRDTGSSDGPASAPDWKANLAGAMEPLAHPQSAGDFAALLVPSELGMGRGGLATVKEAAQRYGSAFKAAAQDTPAGIKGIASFPMRAYGKLKDALPSSNEKAITDFWGGAKPTAAPSRPVTPPSGPDIIDRNLRQPSAAAPSTPAAASAADTETLLRQAGMDPAKMVSSTPGASARATDIKTGRLVKMGEATPPPSPLQQPRVQVGAEAVGRQTGLTKEAVRETTGPIRGEAPGTAAGMPSNPKDRIVEKLINMGPKGQGLPESAREAYAAAGRDPKTRVQVQAYLDALRKVGFAVPMATSAEALRRAVMGRLNGEQP